MSKKTNVIHESGKRKRAYARATLTEGKGDIRINSVPLDVYGDKLAQLRIKEPMIIAKKYVDIEKLDILVNVQGGGFSGQVDAIRTAITRALISFAAKSKKDEALKAEIVAYDRSLIAGDSRRTEPHKPSKSSSGPRSKRQKSYR